MTRSHNDPDEYDRRRDDALEPPGCTHARCGPVCERRLARIAADALTAETDLIAENAALRAENARLRQALAETHQLLKVVREIAR